MSSKTPRCLQCRGARLTPFCSLDIRESAFLAEGDAPAAGAQACREPPLRPGHRRAGEREEARRKHGPHVRSGTFVLPGQRMMQDICSVPHLLYHLPRNGGITEDIGEKKPKHLSQEASLSSRGKENTRQVQGMSAHDCWQAEGRRTLGTVWQVFKACKSPYTFNLAVPYLKINADAPTVLHGVSVENRRTGLGFLTARPQLC